MKWVIDENSRCDFVFFSGINCSGAQSVVRVFPSGRKGEVNGTFRSLIFAASPGLRVYLCTDDGDSTWPDHPWRCVRLLPGIGTMGRYGIPFVRIHDLDLHNEPTALRVPPDEEVGFDEVDDPADGEGWTFGSGSGSLKQNIRMIRIEKER